MGWLDTVSDLVRRLTYANRCTRCGRKDHLIEHDGPVTCRVCILAWGRLAADLQEGAVVREAGGLLLRHASHDNPLLGCPLCRAERRWQTLPQVEGRWNRRS